MKPLEVPRCCEWTIVQRIDAGGSLPAWVINRKIRESLSTPSELHLAFHRDEEIDLEGTSRLISIVKNHSNERYTVDEVASIKTVQDLADAARTTLAPLESPSHFVEMKKSVVEGEKSNTGYAEVVADATVE